MRIRFALVILLAYFFAALAAPILTPYTPYEQRVEERFSPPFSEHFILGSDSLGRDIYTRLIFATRTAFVVGGISVVIALLIGVPVALFASYTTRVVDSLLMLIMDSVLSLPAILLLLVSVTVFGYGIVQITLALGVVFSPYIARLLRAEINKARNQEFVQIESMYNRPQFEIFRKTVFPQIFPPLIVQITNLFAIAVSIESSLSFLGLGVQPPHSSWGIMLTDARNYLLSHAWLAIPPGIAIITFVYSINAIGDYISEKNL